MAEEKTPKKSKTPKKKRPQGAAEIDVERSRKLLELDPDQLPLTARRAEYLAAESGVEAKKLVGRPLTEVHDELRWRLDPGRFLFRRICGRVVKKDPVTGELLPVPNATVHLEDTDCNYLAYLPKPLPWVWIYPLGCRREVIATVRTDHCGEFCFHVPLWDIDRILTWRRARICLWEYHRPHLRDVLQVDPERIDFPRPLPDPPPFLRLGPEELARVRDFAGEEAMQRLEAVRELSLQGEKLDGLEEVLDEPLFTGSVPPPLPPALVDHQDQRTRPKGGEEKKAAADEGLAELEDHLSAHDLSIARLDVHRFIGPFRRCRDIYVGTWQTVLDVPDLTFRVTQDYDGDGVEELIYAESHFDVRWSSGPIPDVTLEAWPQAASSPHCGPRQVIPCGNAPSIESAGYLDLEPPYHDDTTGYCVRVNRPSATGDFPPPPSTGAPGGNAATAPYTGNVNLHGCVRLDDATHYRLLQEYRLEPSDPWGSQQVIKNVSWNAPRLGLGPTIPFQPDADGWYSLAVDPDDLVHPNWLLPWRPSDPGQYRLEVELGRLTGGNIQSQGTSNPRVFRVDNRAPTTQLVEVRWRPASIGEGVPWTDGNSTKVLPAPANTCPRIERPTGQDIHLRVVWMASAGHLLSAQLVSSGCGGGGLVRLDGGVEAYRHWHTGPGDNSVSQSNRYLLPGSRPPGCYSLGLRAWSRAFNPQDANAASTFDWWVNDHVRHSLPSWALSVVDV